MSKRGNLKEDKPNAIQQKLLGANISDIDLEKFRASLKANSHSTMQSLNGKLSKDILKQVSGKFSLEIIFSLDLSRQSLTQIKDLAGCTNLAFLDISNNRVGDLGPLAGLKEL